MKKTLLFSALLLASGCGGGAFKNWSYAGLDYNRNTGQFSGIANTAPGNTPPGSAAYTGKYKSSSLGKLFGQGDASMDVNFGTSAVQLVLTGAVNATGNGVITGTGFSGADLQLGFDGEFYGNNAAVAAGLFYVGASDSTIGQFIVSQ